MSSSNYNGDYDWYYSSDQQYRYYNDNNGEAFPSTNNEAAIFADTFHLQSSHDLPDLDIETAKKGENKLGLKLTKTPSLLSLFSSASITDDSGLSSSPEKLKAANFPALSLQIGSWMRESRHEGELIAKCYFKKRQLVWEVLNGSLKNKIEFQWSNISAIKATFHINGPGVLDIMLEKPPLFFHEVNPQPRKHTNWEQSGDFTKNQASLIRKHRLIFGPGVLEKHYNKIVQADSKLHHISQQPFPEQASMYFNEIQFSNQLCFNNLSAALPPQVPLNHPSVMDFSGHTTSANYPVHQDLSPNIDDRHYYLNDQSQFAISSSASQESTANQQAGYVYPSVNAPMTNDVGLNPLGYAVPQDYLQQMEPLGTNLPYMGESHQPSYNYEEGVADHHQPSYDYQSQQYYHNAGHQWL